MPTVIAIHWNATELPFVVAEDGQIVAAASVELQTDMQPAAIGKRLAEALAPYSPGRAKTVVALGRGAFEWQHLMLPPCSAEELPDMVRLQADRELSSADEDLGFDFLPLVGDEQTSYEVLTLALEESELAKVRDLCRAANLTLERIVPLAAGWIALTQQATRNVQPGTQIFVAPQATNATLWATRAGRVVLFRQFQLAAGADPAALAGAIGNELRRTLLTLSQHTENGSPTVAIVGPPANQLTELAATLQEQLDIPVQSQDVTTQHTAARSPNTWHEPSSPPLAGFAVDESQGNKPLVDVLHPRRRPQKQINVRTYSLAAIAGTLVIGTLFWSSYAKLHAPLNQAAKDQAELTLLEESEEELKAHEDRAAAIRDWQVETPNLLRHLQQVSKSIRPKALEDEDFVSDQDVVLEKLDLDKRQLTLEALARDSKAVQPLENRLRESAYRPQRGKSDPSETNKEYPWQFKSTIEITTASDNFEPTESGNATPDASAVDPKANDTTATDSSASQTSDGKQPAEPKS